MVKPEEELRQLLKNNEVRSELTESELQLAEKIAREGL